jgi:diguanylate cyclase (GGDEF)-like protein
MSGTTNYGSSFLCPDARLGDSLSTAGVGCCRKAALHRGKSRQFVLSEATLRQDAATALPNFFAFLHEAPDILQATSGIALLLDLTGLRAINADGGTAAGDDHVGLLAAVLREITAASAPPAPRCYRLGGDEFLLFLPDADGGDAEWWTAHVNAALSALAHRRANGRSCPRVQGTAVPYPGPTGSVAELLASVYREVDTSRGSEANSIVPRLLNRIDETLSLLIEARLQAHTDVVSGLPNHRAAESALSAALKSPLTRNFSVLLVDGDDLRAYNALGYEAGNQMIRDLGRLLSERLREGDVLTRWLSGDEYLIILQGAGRRDALTIADRLCRHVARFTADWSIPITVSIGVASAPEDGHTVERLIQTVEIRATEAKRAGKDCVA